MPRCSWKEFLRSICKSKNIERSEGGEGAGGRNANKMVQETETDRGQ